MKRPKITMKQARRIARRLDVVLEVSTRETNEYVIGGALNLAVLTHVRRSTLAIAETQYQGETETD